MENNIKNEIQNIASKLKNNYEKQGLFELTAEAGMPERKEILALIEDLRRITFPGYFGRENLLYVSKEHFAGNEVSVIYERVFEQIKAAVAYDEALKDCGRLKLTAEELAVSFIRRIPYVQDMILKDVTAEFDGDPAAKNKEDIILSYPGIYAIFVYRYAHELYELNIPYIPRIMTEHAHSKTGIDINPGAKIGEYFCIDHGTGIVIGETTEIGSHVKIYQGVTLGALSLSKGQALSGVKRHPTIEDNVVIYANTTVLGGDTVIGANSVISGNTFITESVPANTKVSSEKPQLELRKTK